MPGAALASRRLFGLPAVVAPAQGTGYAVVQAVPAPSLRDAPVTWQARADRVEDALAERHAADPRWDDSQEQSARIGTLIAGGHLRPALLHAVAV